MPLINGQKMACEPCIRGHRSTKCTHANERLMVPVRKPGRPLSSCPHPPNRNCGCAGVTAAIPRKQKCVCGSGPAPQSSSPASPANVSSSVVSPTRSTFRIQKPSLSKPSSSAARKLSAGVSLLEKMDPSQINILSPPSPFLPMPQHAPNGPASISPYPYIPIASGSFSPRPNLAYTAQQAQPPHIAFMVPAPSHRVQNGSTPVPVAVPKTPSPRTEASCCCPQPASTVQNGTNGTRTAAIPPSTAAVTSSTAATASGSPAALNQEEDARFGSGGRGENCCGGASIRSHGGAGNDGGGGRRGADSPSSGQHPSQSGVNGANGGMKHTNPAALMPQLPPSMDIFPQFYQPQPTIYTYPPMYGTSLHPLQPAQWREAMASIDYGNQHGAPPHVPLASYNAAPADANANTSSAPDAFSAGPNSTGTTHQCSCGNGCQCVGCAAHPYNEATQRYVRSAWNSMAPDGAGSGGPPATPTEPYQNGLHGHGPSGIPVEDESPPAAQTPSDTASNDEQALSASDFFFVTYPFAGEGGCGGDTASCPCGDDCQCLGCTIHNNHAGPTLPS